MLALRSHQVVLGLMLWSNVKISFLS